MSLFGNNKGSGNELSSEVSRVAKLVNNGKLDDRLLILFDLERVLSDEELAQVAAVGEMHG